MTCDIGIKVKGSLNGWALKLDLETGGNGKQEGCPEAWAHQSADTTPL